MTNRDSHQSFIKIGQNWIQFEHYRRQRETLDQIACVLFVIFAGAMLLLAIGVM